MRKLGQWLFSRQGLFALFSLAVTVGVMGFLLTRVPIEKVLQTVFNMNRQALMAFFVFSITMSVFRTWRYVVLLRVSGLKPLKIPLFLIVIVRNLFSDLLPARIGTLVYIYLVNNRLNVPFAAATSSFATSFLFDILILAPMILVAVLLAGNMPELNPLNIALAALLLTFVCLILYKALPAVFQVMARIVSRLTVLPLNWRDKIIMLATDTSMEVQKYQAAGIFGRLLLLSLGVRIAKYGSLYVLLYAMLAPMGYTLAELEIPSVFIGLIVPELAASLPISGIAGFGAYEGAWVLIFTLLGFPQHLAELTSLAHHGFTQFYGYTLGLLALLILWFGFKSKPGNSKPG